MKTQASPVAERRVQAPTTSLSPGSSVGRGNAWLLEQMRAAGPEPEAPGRDSVLDLPESARRPGEALTPEQRDAALDGLRRGSAEAARTLAELEKTEGGLGFGLVWSGRGTYQRAGSIYLDVRGSGLELLVTLAHELVHLLNHRKGNIPSVATDDREPFVQGMMSDELDSETGSLLAGLQLTGGGGEPRSLEFRAYLRRANPGLFDRALRGGDPAAWDEVRKVARAWSETNFRERYKTSTTGQNYYQYWEGWWDQQNPSEKDGRQSGRSVGPAPAPGAPARAAGAVAKDPLTVGALDPVKGKLTGPELMINDNPETFRSPGLIGSTIAPMKDRGDATHDFQGSMRYFGLAQNGAGRALRNSIVVKNLEDRDLIFTIRGVVFGKNVTKTDGEIPKGYGPSGFRGPHAVAASSFLDGKPGENGFIEKKVKVGAGELKVLNEQYHEAGDEIFTLVDVKCDDPRAKFRLAASESAGSLDAKALSEIGNGSYPSAGRADGKDFAAGDRSRLGRPNGVAAGSRFAGGRTIPLSRGMKEGDLVLGTRFKHAGTADNESARLTDVPGNKPGVGPAATIDEGNYGIQYELSYVLKNPGAECLTCEVLFTAPKMSAAEQHRPLGGELTIPMNVNGQRREVRVDARGEGVVVGVFTVGPGKDQPVKISFVHMGNTFPPAGFEFRVP